MKRIILSLAMIALVASSAVAATRAYFSDSQVLGSNTFATGTVSLDKNQMWGLPINITNMAPGGTYSTDVYINYTGSLNADLWLGVTGTTPQGDPKYFADKMTVVITEVGRGTWYSGSVEGLSQAWAKIADNFVQGQQYHYTLQFTVDPTMGNNQKGQTNTDTEFLLYTVQSGGSAPTTIPVSEPLSSPYSF